MRSEAFSLSSIMINSLLLEATVRKMCQETGTYKCEFAFFERGRIGKLNDGNMKYAYLNLFFSNC